MNQAFSLANKLYEKDEYVKNSLANAECNDWAMLRYPIDVMSAGFPYWLEVTLVFSYS